MNYGFAENSSRSTMSTMAFTRVRTEFINRVYGWMCGGLAITGIIAGALAGNEQLMTRMVNTPFLFLGIIIGTFALVVIMSAAAHKLSATAATMCFVSYAALNGVLFSTIFYQFTMESIASTFFVTSGTFGVMSLYGYVTKRDLTSLGNLCAMALVGLIIASIVNMFWANTTLYWVVTYVGILIFVGLIAYDTQKIKQMALAIGDDLSATDSGKKYAIFGALTLYLDFINLFLLLLRIMGNRRS